MKVSMIICAPLKKSPNCASQIGRRRGFSILMPYSKPRTASSDSGLLATYKTGVINGYIHTYLFSNIAKLTRD